MNGGGFHHDAFFYRTDDEFAATLVPYLCEGIARGEGVAVATTRARSTVLRDALGPDAGAVLFLPDDQWYVRPAATIAGWARVAAASAARGRPRARLVGEVRFGSPDRYPSWVRFESALNRALAGCAVTLVCPYNMRTLPPRLLHEGRRTHPTVFDGRRHANGFYLAPELLLAEVSEPRFPVAGRPALDVPVGDTVANLRDTVRDHGTAQGWLPPDRLDDLVLALSEIATNGVRYGGNRRRLAVWVLDGAVVCEVSDDGAGPVDPLAGYLPPVPGTIGGMGLWLVHQICDSLSIDTSGGRTRVRFAVSAG